MSKRKSKNSFNQLALIGLFTLSVVGAASFQLGRFVPLQANIATGSCVLKTGLSANMPAKVINVLEHGSLLKFQNNSIGYRTVGILKSDYVLIDCEALKLNSVK